MGKKEGKIERLKNERNKERKKERKKVRVSFIM